MDDLVHVDIAPIDGPPGLERLTARVASIDADGRLHLAARMTITTDQRREVTELSGACAPGDIGLANSVDSAHLTNLRIVVTRERP